MNRKPINPLLIALVLMSAFACSGPKQQDEPVGEENTAPTEVLVTQQLFGEMPDGREVSLYTMKNANGLEMTVMNYGGIIVSLKTPHKDGNLQDITLGYDSLSSYIENNAYFGALIGRYGNRIANGKFSLDNEEYALATNDGKNHLHGGIKGFDKVYWDIQVIDSVGEPSINLTYRSQDGEEGYPGNLNVEVVYTLTKENALKITYSANTDKKTIVNLTQHAYFNLTGNPEEDILGHQLVINADEFLPVDETLIPTGELRSVQGTPFDFTAKEAIGARIEDDNTQLGYGQGYDHCWVLRESLGLEKAAAILTDTVSGRKMEVFTTEPGMQFYSGNFLDGNLKGKQGIAYQKRTGLCLETQHFPDSPNQPDFPSVVLSPGETYNSTTIYKFSVEP